MRIVWFTVCVRTISVSLCMAENQLPECWALGRSVWSTHFDDVTSRFRVEEMSTPACRLTTETVHSTEACTEQNIVVCAIVIIVLVSMLKIHHG